MNRESALSCRGSNYLVGIMQAQHSADVDDRLTDELDGGLNSFAPKNPGFDPKNPGQSQPKTRVFPGFDPKPGFFPGCFVVCWSG